MWAGWSDFWAMGGYAGYVWGAYGVTLALLAAEVATLRLRRRRVMERLRSGAQGEA